MNVRRRVVIAVLLAVSPMSLSEARPCRVAAVDAYLGADSSGEPRALGLKANVTSYAANGYLGSLFSSPEPGVTLIFEAILPRVEGLWTLGSATTDRAGWALFDLHSIYGRDSLGYYLISSQDGQEVIHRLDESVHLQIVTSVPQLVEGCEGEVPPDVFGSAYFRLPSDTSPVLLSDFDDTLFNSSDPVDWMRTAATGHYAILDNYVVEATHQFRDYGGVFIGITAQPSSLRPFTRSELLDWNLDIPYSDAEYYYDLNGYDGTYLPRTLTWIANDEYDPDASVPRFERDHCAFKVEKFNQLVNDIFGARWNLVVGMIGDTEESDGCAARTTGVHWYALMEGRDTVENTSDPSSYTEIRGGWQEALPLICADAGLLCGQGAQKTGGRPGRGGSRGTR